MDLINNRTRDVAQMALDGLYERSKAIAANSANVLTPNYKRKEVSFESSLQNIIKREDEKEAIRLQNAQLYAKNPSELLKNTDSARLAFMSTDTTEGFFINVQEDSADAIDTDGNNVNIENEMMDEAKVGMQYQVLTHLLSQSYNQMQSIISGQNQ